MKPLYITVPSFYLMSLFERQKEKYCQRHARARQDLDDFVAQVDNEDVAKVFRSYVANVPWGFRLNGERLPEIPAGGRAVLDEFLCFNRREAVPIWKIRHCAFSFYEPLTPPHMFWCYGLDWHDIELMEEDRKLRVGRVEGLLEMLIEREPVVSGDNGWERTFRRKRRRLTWLFRTALKLEEDLKCWL